MAEKGRKKAELPKEQYKEMDTDQLMAFIRMYFDFLVSAGHKHEDYESQK